MQFFLKLNKFSQKIITGIFLLAVIIILIGVSLLKKSACFSELFTARKLLEAGFTLFPCAILAVAVIEYLIKRAAS